jgi:hypothetical protein
VFINQLDQGIQRSARPRKSIHEYGGIEVNNHDAGCGRPLRRRAARSCLSSASTARGGRVAFARRNGSRTASARTRSPSDKRSAPAEYAATASRTTWFCGLPSRAEVLRISATVASSSENVTRDPISRAGRLPRAGFFVTNLPLPNRAVVGFYNKRGTAEQWIEKRKQAALWTRLSYHRFRKNEVRLQLSVLAYNTVGASTGHVW